MVTEAKDKDQDTKKTRGERRFLSITYSLIAKLSGLTLATARAYGARKHYNPRDLDSVLSWINTRRAAAGLPLIGQPDPGAQPPATPETISEIPLPLPPAPKLDTLESGNLPPAHP
jgi:hypothetical protein